MKVAKIYTLPSFNALEIANGHECWENCGQLSARNAVTGCMSDGGGIFFLHGIDDDAVDFIAEKLNEDERVESFSFEDDD